MNRLRVPERLWIVCRRQGIRPTRFLLAISVTAQSMALFERSREPTSRAPLPQYEFRRRFRISTSRFGTGQTLDSKQTPLGLHRVARKVGGGYPVGTIFKSRQAIGLTWKGQSDGAILHRILWLEGLEPGFNRGGPVDTLQRYIYIHGFGDETTLGRPQSRGCIHLGVSDLMPLYEQVPVGTLVYVL